MAESSVEEQQLPFSVEVEVVVSWSQDPQQLDFSWSPVDEQHEPFSPSEVATVES